MKNLDWSEKWMAASLGLSLIFIVSCLSACDDLMGENKKVWAPGDCFLDVLGYMWQVKELGRDGSVLATFCRSQSGATDVFSSGSMEHGVARVSCFDKCKP